MEADLSNDTFYANESHVSCLFKHTNFILDFGAERSGVGFWFDIDHPETICAFVKDVPKGGLTLGEIRKLSRALINECGKCGRMTVNYLSKNESELGWLKFDWRNNPICQENGIDPEKDLKSSNSTNNNGNDENDTDENGGTILNGFVSSKSSVAGFLSFWAMAGMIMYL